MSKASVAIVGGGTAGLHAAAVAMGLQAQVTLLDINLNRLELIDKIFMAGCKLFSLTKKIWRRQSRRLILS